jgi:hypothetical protein
MHSGWPEISVTWEQRQWMNGDKSTNRDDYPGITIYGVWDKEVTKSGTCLLMNTNGTNIRKILVIERGIKWH